MEKLAIFLSEIELLPVKPKEGLVCWASFVLNDQFYVGNIAIHTTPEGKLRCVYPEHLLPNGKRINIAHPITKEAGSLILFEISKKYQQITGENYP